MHEDEGLIRWSENGYPETKVNHSNLDQRCLGVLVTYNPQPDLLRRVVDEALKQTRFLAVIDNGSRNLARIHDVLDGRKTAVTLLASERNQGIAWALNRGIEACKKHGAEFVITLDQDTVLGSNCVRRMLECYVMNDSRARLGVVAPTLIQFGEPIPLAEGFEVKRMVPTSGSLIPVKVYDEVGLYKESLFIYHVDDEFCIRVHKAGYKIVMARGAWAWHREGDARIKWFNPLALRWQVGPARRPGLLYYIARNGVYIVLYVDRQFFGTSRQVLLGNLGASVSYYGKPHVCLWSIAVGVLHGLLKRMGPYNVQREVGPGACERREVLGSLTRLNAHLGSR